LCRFHHLVKTFHDWTDHQYPDGTVVWTSPTGHTYVTRPEGAHWFAQLGTSTGVVSVADTVTPGPWRGQAMPTRSRTRAQERSANILAERHGNQERLDEQRQHEQLAAANDEPPPF
ncbi:MAG: HNH endonuclease, partial [Mycobacterium sp.]